MFVNDIFKRFNNLNVMNRIKRDYGIKPGFVRFVEPHKDGIAHVHAIYFIPKDYKDEVVEAFVNNFVVGGFKNYNKSSLVSKEKFGKYKYHQVDIKGSYWDPWYGNEKDALKYIVKYVSKNLHESNPYLKAWYSINGVRRMYTSIIKGVSSEYYQKTGYTFKTYYNYIKACLSNNVVFMFKYKDMGDYIVKTTGEIITNGEALSLIRSDKSQDISSLGVYLNEKELTSISIKKDGDVEEIYNKY
jgi:hypothetical protein